MTPQLWVFAGPNGAGKSTLARRYACGRIEVVSPDDIAREIARGRGGDPSMAARAGRLAIERRQALRDAHQSFGIETTLAGCSERAFMAETRNHGFKVNLVFVGIGSIIQSRSRVAERVKRGGHPVLAADLERRFARSMAHLPDAMRIAQRSLVFDNSGKRCRLILSRENDHTKLVSRSLPHWARAAIPVALRQSPAEETLDDAYGDTGSQSDPFDGGPPER